MNAAFGEDDVTDNPITTAPTDGSMDDSIITEENIISDVSENSNDESFATEVSPESTNEISDTVIEVTEYASINDPENPDTTTDQSNEVATATTKSENELQSAHDDVNDTTEIGESITNQSDETTENSSSTNNNNNEEMSTSASTEPQLPSSTEVPTFSCNQSGVGRFARPGNCHDYYYCWDSIHDYVTFSCKSKVFDPISKQCVNNWAHCESTPKCEEDHQIMADPDDINSFFVCKSPPGPLNTGFIVQKDKCRGVREFDPQLGYCKEVITESTSSAESEESKKKFECNAVGIYADINDETKFFECTLKSVSKGRFRLKHYSCPKYHVFSLEDMLCIPVQ